ncbi:MAG: GNAT family N-acetyltransferase [Advenella sp.]
MAVEILEIQAAHDHDICNIIKKVGEEFGAIGEGFGPSDAEVGEMSAHYGDQNGSLYLVVRLDGRIVGGCGIAPFNGSHQTCELRKLFLLKEARSLGIGKDLLVRCLAYASQKGYKECYLDTLSGMKSAISLYEKFGFQHLDRPLEGVVHSGCDVWMLKKL